jgi:hypothetical protein
VAFVGLVAVGAVLVAAAKLQFTSLGTGSSPLRVLTASVVSGLATLGTGVRLGGLTIAVVPLGALVASGVLIGWAASSVGEISIRDVKQKLLTAARFAVVLGFLCAGAALIFRIPEEPVPISVPPVQAGVFGVIWGFGFGSLGLFLRGGSLRSGIASGFSQLYARLHGRGREVWVCSAVGLGGLAVTSLIAVLIGLIFRLATSPLPGRFDVGDALAALVFLVAFLPNVLVTVASLSVGAPVTVGAEISAAGERVGPVVHFSLASWGNDATPPVVFLLLLVPVASFLLSGYAARAVSTGGGGPPLHLVASAGITSLVLGALCLISDARLGGGLAGEAGVAKVAPDTVAVVPLAFCWSLALALAGWGIHDLMERRRMHVPRGL